MKFTKRYISLILCILLMFPAVSLSVGAKIVYPEDNWVYELINNSTEVEIDEYRGDLTSLSTVSYFNNKPVVSIGEHAFINCKSLIKININSPITAIHSFAFLNNKTLETVLLNGGLNTINSSAFSGCSSLSTINLEDTKIDSIGYSVFMNCDSLTEITLPETVVSIDDKAFAYCDALTKITIPESVTEIHEKAFYNTPNVVIYCYENSNAHLFAEENSIEYVLLEPPVTYILGDVDNSGEVSILDATEVQLLIAQLVEPQDEYTQLRADIDCDGVLSIMDATSIQMYIAGYEVDEPIGETFEV